MGTRTRRIFVPVVISFLLFASCSVRAQDLQLTHLRLYGIFEGGERRGSLFIGEKEVTLEPGELARLEITEYKPLLGVDPDLIDIGCTVSNRGPKLVTDVEVRISIAARVGYLVFIPELEGSGEDPSTANVEATKKTAAWFTPALLFRKRVQKIPAGGSIEVVFEKINLKNIIEQYSARKLWPTELRIEASVEPKGREDSLSNNTMSRTFRINLPPY